MQEGASGPLAVRWADPDARGRKGDEHADDLDDRTVSDLKRRLHCLLYPMS